MTGQKLLILGLGNPILGDDGVGWKVAEQIKSELAENGGKEVEVDCLSVGGLSLMERMIDYDRVILLDAIVTQDHPVGTVIAFPLKDLPNCAFGHLSSSHDTTLQNALEVGRTMGAHLPDDIWVVGIEALHVYDFSEMLSPSVEASIGEAVRKAMYLVSTPVSELPDSGRFIRHNFQSIP